MAFAPSSWSEWYGPGAGAPSRRGQTPPQAPPAEGVPVRGEGDFGMPPERREPTLADPNWQPPPPPPLPPRDPPSVMPRMPGGKKPNPNYRPPTLRPPRPGSPMPPGYAGGRRGPIGESLLAGLQGLKQIGQS